jgi:hypothetical protein
MDRRQFLQLASSLSIGSVALVAGCGGGGTTKAVPDIPYGRGAIAGFVFQDAAGVLYVRATATVPGGMTPAHEVRAEIAAEEVVGAVGTDGALTLGRIRSGPRTLRLIPASGTPLEIALTVIPDATVVLGTPPIPRTQAIDLAREALTQELGTTNLRILGPQQPLPAGVAIEPALDLLNPAMTAIVRMTTTAPVWFFFADATPGTVYGHSVRYAMVDAQTGAVTIASQQSWPNLNGCHFYGNEPDNLTSPDLVLAESRAEVPVHQRLVEKAGITRAQEIGGKTFALFVWATRLDANFKDARNIKTIFGHAGIPLPAAEPRDPFLPSKTPRLAVTQNFEAMCAEAGPEDTVLLHIIAHGGLRPGEGSEPPLYAMWLPGFPPRDGTKTEDSGEWLFPSDFDFGKCRACRIVIIAATCYSGNWIPWAKQTLDKPGNAVTLATAADSVHTDGGGPQLGPLNAYYFVEEAAKLPADAGQEELAQIYPRIYGPSNPNESNPLTYIRIPTDDESCVVSLEPQKRQIGTFRPLPMTMTVARLRTGDLTYRWSANIGTFSTASGVKGATFDTRTLDPVSFESDVAGDASVQVSVLEIAGGKESLLGKATARIEVKPLTVKIDPPVTAIGPADSATLTASVENYELDTGDRFEYQWKSTTVAGALVGATTGTSVVYTAARGKKGTDTVTVEAFVATAAGNRFSLGTTTATVNVAGTKVVDVPATLVFTDDSGANRILGDGHPVLVWGFTFPTVQDAVSYRVELVAKEGLERRSVAGLTAATIGPSGTFPDIWSQPQRLAPFPYEITAGGDNYGWRGGFFHVQNTVYVPMGFTGYGEDNNYKTRAEAEQGIRDYWYAASQRQLLVQATVSI